jgi:hypothetical protein
MGPGFLSPFPLSQFLRCLQPPFHPQKPEGLKFLTGLALALLELQKSSPHASPIHAISIPLSLHLLLLPLSLLLLLLYIHKPLL